MRLTKVCAKEIAVLQMQREKNFIFFCSSSIYAAHFHHRRRRHRQTDEKTHFSRWSAPFYRSRVAGKLFDTA